MKNIEVVDGKVYIKEAEDALQKEKEYLEKSITSFKKDLELVNAKLKAQQVQKSELQRKAQVIAELQKEAIEHNEKDSIETLEAKLPVKEEVKEEIVKEEVVLDTPQK